MFLIFVVWYKTDFVNLTKAEIEALKAKVIKITHYAYGHF